MDAASRTQPKILIVDDDMILASLYRKKFQGAGFVVDVAENGATALLKVSQSRPDIVLLDLMLGDMNGVEVLEVLRMNETTRNLPVVVFSSVFLGSLMDQAAKAGASKCLNKSGCPPHRVIDTVQTILSLKPAPAAPATLPPLASVDAKATAGKAASPAGTRPAATSLLTDDIEESVRRDLLDHVKRRIEDIERALPRWIENADNFDAPYLPALYRAVRAVAGAASLVGRLRLSRVAGALEALLKQVRTARSVLTPSLTRTVSEAVELLPELTPEFDSPQTEAFLSPLLLVVGSGSRPDPDVVQALETAQLRALTVHDAELASRLAESNRFDLVIIDVASPGHAGPPLADHLHGIAGNETTPVVFLIESESADGTEVPDYIAKPFLPLELAVKVLIHLHRGRLAATR